jgi:hypothetical protein
LSMFTANPSVTGFMIESAVLSSIRSHGLAIGENIGRPMKMKLFADSFNIATDIIGQPVLYCPKKFNHEAIDGIIVHIEPIKPIEEKHPKKYKWDKKKNAEDNEEENEEEQEEDEKDKDYKKKDYKKKDYKKEKKRQKLRIFPLQITLALSTHKDSHAQFFDRYYDKWAKGLSDFDVESQFLWITPDRRDAIEHPKKGLKWPKHVERFIHLQDVNAIIWRQYQEARGDTG